MSTAKLNIGLFGFGVVGEGLYQVLKQTPSLNATIKKVCIKDATKQRNAPDIIFTTDKDELLQDESLDIIVEVINDADAAYHIIKAALLNGKDVVSANKKVIADHLQEFLDLQQQTKKSFLYESAACASIPVIRNLEEYYDNDLLHSIQAIVNGSTNFILTKMFEEGLKFSDALSLAQELGYAESDPKLDVEGYDSLNKWTFLITHAYGIVTAPESILFNGIQNITLEDATLAKSKNQHIKLVAFAKKIADKKVAAFVLPQFITEDHPFAFVKNEYNGVLIESAFADRQFFYGKGAGSFPTASAVLSDISALLHNYRYEYKKLYLQQPHELIQDVYLNVYVSFNNWEDIRKEEFENITEYNVKIGRNYIIGNIHIGKLINSNWWKKNEVSLILLPEPIIDKPITFQTKNQELIEKDILIS